MTDARFALVPAAGSGSRLGEALPKQYLPLAGRPLLHHALAILLDCAALERVYVVLAPGDPHFRRHAWPDLGNRLVPLFCGGASRAATVFNALMAVRDDFEPADWVLVHDAARPCLDAASLERLITETGDDEVGGLLAVPVTDTLKRDDGGVRVEQTHPRERLWRAQTPQMIRCGLLAEALHRADPARVTDEASAVEAMGLCPRLVRGSETNLKVTYPQDLVLAAAILAAAAAGGTGA
jgi:2-C-methyl-D-erythritol 4-phosphate cytidylyltransferase